MTPEQVLLFGGYELSGDVASNVGGRGHRTIDDWIIVEGKCTDSVNVLSNARREVNAALDLKLMYPRRPLPESYNWLLMPWVTPLINWVTTHYIETLNPNSLMLFS